MQRDRWVDYPRAIEACLRLERLLGTPERERMPCMVLHGESNIGKTLIVRKFQHDHPTVFDAVRGVERRRIVAMQIPATPDQKRFYSALLFVSWRMVKKPRCGGLMKGLISWRRCEFTPSTGLASQGICLSLATTKARSQSLGRLVSDARQRIPPLWPTLPQFAYSRTLSTTFIKRRKLRQKYCY